MIPLRDTIPSRRAPVVTWSIIAVNLAVFLYELTLDPHSLQQLFHVAGLVPARYTVLAGTPGVDVPLDSYWPLVTSMFLHGGWGHFLGNMWMLWIFGDNVEDRLGPVRYLVFYFITGIAAGVTHWLTNPDSIIPTVGASGAISGVLGAYLVLFPQARIIAVLPILFFPYFFAVPAVVFLGVWFLTQLLSGSLAGLGPGDLRGVAWWAHVGGFIAGAVLQWPLSLGRDKAPSFPERDGSGIEGAWAAR